MKSNGTMTVNLKKYERKLPWPTLRYYSRIYWGELEKERKKERNLGQSTLRAENENYFFRNQKQDF